MINHVMKHGSSLANTFGVVTLMYSGFGVLFSWARGTDDSFNTLSAATATGMLFKSTGTMINFFYSVQSIKNFCVICSIFFIL